jgi:hypothetical protein
MALGTATLALSAVSAFAQPYGRPASQSEQRTRERAEARSDRQEDRADRQQDRTERQQDRTERRETRRDWREWRSYNQNRFEPGYGGYYAENYYRSGYRPMRVTRNTRIYRGNNGRYYCRRNDGTTGLIIGAAIGSAAGNRIGHGESRLLSTLLGASAGALLGREIERGGVTCR